jgi:hypothetical protein
MIQAGGMPKCKIGLGCFSPYPTSPRLRRPGSRTVRKGSHSHANVELKNPKISIGSWRAPGYVGVVADRKSRSSDSSHSSKESAIYEKRMDIRIKVATAKVANMKLISIRPGKSSFSNQGFFYPIQETAFLDLRS